MLVGQRAADDAVHAILIHETWHLDTAALGQIRDVPSIRNVAVDARWTIRLHRFDNERSVFARAFGRQRFRAVNQIAKLLVRPNRPLLHVP
jgi:hypothetical protein